MTRSTMENLVKTFLSKKKKRIGGLNGQETVSEKEEMRKDREGELNQYRKVRAPKVNALKKRTEKLSFIYALHFMIYTSIAFYCEFPEGFHL